MDINLLEKTELWIENLTLENVDLNKIAEVTAQVLDLPRDKVLVVDVRQNTMTIDILQKKIKAEQFYGKKQELLDALSQIEGVKVLPETSIHSDGILGYIALDRAEAAKTLEKTQQMSKEIATKIKKRVIVFPTGSEVKKGMIKDTNTPLIRELLEREGFYVSTGDVIDDDSILIAGKIRRAVNDGYGLIITTGGIGAEDKDKTVEGVLKIDPQAATPYIVKFQKGTGRHEKDGVRIGVGQIDNTLIVALPGPNDEVKISMDILSKALRDGGSKHEIANKLAEALREKLKEKFYHCRH
ncbi:MAG: molybdopterin-binding protein [Bacillota bacterium]